MNESEFFPRGAIAFLVAVLATFAVIWLSVFWLMIDRTTPLNPQPGIEEVGG
ncbi:MAG: hypothetical protein AAGJ31_00040 [Verrucomicrobiota bacterium]